MTQAAPVEPPRTIRFDSVDDALAEINRLRAGHSPRGNWTLPQIAYHLRLPLENVFKPLATTEPTNDELAARIRLDHYLTHRRPASGYGAPQHYLPPDKADDVEIDRLIDALKRLKTLNTPTVFSGSFGPISLEMARRFHLIHAAHHLSFLVPNDAPPPRRKLSFASDAQIIEDMKNLRKAGYVRRGTWSLPQICLHLNNTISGSLTPSDHDVPTEEERAMKDKFFGMVLGPAGLPENLPLANPPPADADDSEIDRFFDALKQLEACPHPLIKVGRCGPVPKAELQRVHRAHAAHHLSFLTAIPPSK